MQDEIIIGNKKYNLSDLCNLEKSEVEKSNNRSLIDIFNAINTNGDNILDTSEVSVFAAALKKADTNNDGNISKSELKKFIKENENLVDGDTANSSKVKSKNLLNFFTRFKDSPKAQETGETEGSSVQTDYAEMSDDEVKETVAQMTEEEVKNGLSIIANQDDGIISKSYNGIKEYLGSNMAKSTLVKNLYIKNETAQYLKRAQSGDLTREEYYSGIKNTLLETFPGIENYTPEQKAKLMEFINGLEPAQIERLQKKILSLPNPDDANYKTELANFANDFALEAAEESTINYSAGDSVNLTKTQMKPKEPYNIQNGDELMSFEEVFKTRNGIEYSRENIEKLNDASSAFQLAGLVEQQKTRLHELLDSPINLNQGNNAYGVDPKTDEASKKQLENALLTYLRENCGNDESKMTQLLRQMSCNNDIEVKNGKIEYVQNPSSPFNMQMSSSALAGIGKNILSNIDKKALDAGGGKTIQQLSTELEEAYKNAYGSANLENLSNAYIQDQENAVGYTRAGIEYAGIAAMLVGSACCPLLAVGGSLVSGFGGIGAEMINEKSRQNVSQEKIDELKKELQQNAALLAAGFGAGTAGNAAKLAALSKSCPKLVQFAAEKGTDVTLSLISNLIVTGEINLEGEGRAQILSLIAGLKLSKVKGGLKSVKTGFKNKNHMKLTPDEAGTPSLKKAPDTFNLHTVKNKNDVKNILKELHQSAKSSKAYTDDELEKIAQNLLKMKKKNPVEYQKMIDSGIFEMIKKGEMDFDVLGKLENGNVIFSKEFLEDCRKQTTGEPVIKDYPQGTSLAEVAGKTPNGEAVTVGSKLYINKNGSMVELNMTKEKYLELFPPGERFSVMQKENKHAGNCWFLETLNNLYKNESTRADIATMFRQDGDDIYVKLPNSDVEMKFPGGNVPKGAVDILSNSCSGMQMIEVAAAFQRGEQPAINNYMQNPDIFYTDSKGNKIFDVSKAMTSHNAVLTRLYAGLPEEAVGLLTKNSKTEEFTIDWIKSKSEQKAEAKKVEEALKQYAGKDGYVLNTGLGVHAYAIKRVENGKVYVEDPYDTRLELVLDMKEFLESCRYLSVTKTG